MPEGGKYLKATPVFLPGLFIAKGHMLTALCLHLAKSVSTTEVAIAASVY